MHRAAPVGMTGLGRRPNFVANRRPGISRLGALAELLPRSACIEWIAKRPWAGWVFRLLAQGSG